MCLRSGVPHGDATMRALYLVKSPGRVFDLELEALSQRTPRYEIGGGPLPLTCNPYDG